VTGVDLHGAAGGWWDQAAGRYQRGQTPALGSILVFRRTGRIPSGHVAVVSKLMGTGEILVDHANWYRGTVSHDMAVIDTSPNHDWTMVALMDRRSGQLGANYPTYGFVYTQIAPHQLVAASDNGGFDWRAASARVIFDPSQQPGLFHFALGDGDGYRRGRGRRRLHSYSGRYSGWRAHTHAVGLVKSGMPTSWDAHAHRDTPSVAFASQN
jgi:hypothetical protein